MRPQPRNVQNVYLVLTLFSTLAASFIWGINTLFLLDAGLSPTAAFAANAFFTVGMLLFEVPTGAVADTWGRRVSYLLGALTLIVSTVLYWVAWQVHAPFWAWAVTSTMLGLGFTFFSGATEAWLVDALRFTGYKGSLEPIFSKAQVVSGGAMLLGTMSGGLIAQWTDLGVPYILRALALVVTLAIAYVTMRDWGFTPKPNTQPANQMRQVLHDSLRHGLGNPPVRWVMLSAPFVNGVVIYAAYAMQPYLLDLYGDQQAYGIAGLSAALFAGAQMAGGMLAPRLRALFRRRTSMLLAGTLLSVALLVLVSVNRSFWAAIVLLLLWALSFAATMPVRQAYINDLIPSEQRATVLSFDNMLASGGGVAVQPALGKAADAWSYPTSYLLSATIQLAGAPLLLLARRERTPPDRIERVHTHKQPAPAEVGSTAT